MYSILNMYIHKKCIKTGVLSATIMSNDPEALNKSLTCYPIYMFICEHTRTHTHKQTNSVDAFFPKSGVGVVNYDEPITPRRHALLLLTSTPESPAFPMSFSTCSFHPMCGRPLPVLPTCPSPLISSHQTPKPPLSRLPHQTHNAFTQLETTTLP
jgi:hypothetical protein